MSGGSDRKCQRVTDYVEMKGGTPPWGKQSTSWKRNQSMGEESKKGRKLIVVPVAFLEVN